MRSGLFLRLRNSLRCCAHLSFTYVHAKFGLAQCRGERSAFEKLYNGTVHAVQPVRVAPCQSHGHLGAEDSRLATEKKSPKKHASASYSMGCKNPPDMAMRNGAALSRNDGSSLAARTCDFGSIALTAPRSDGRAAMDSIGDATKTEAVSG